MNGKSEGVIQSQPYTKKIELEAGKNEVSVVVYGSLKNVFGPHHVISKGFMRPPAFRIGKEKMPAGTEYDLLDYGLMEDFEIYELIERNDLFNENITGAEYKIITKNNICQSYFIVFLIGLFSGISTNLNAQYADIGN